MSDTELADLMTRTPPALEPDIARRILDEALVSGTGRRRRRHFITGACSVAALATVATGISLVTAVSDSDELGRRPDQAGAPASTLPPSPPTTYAAGSETEVPGGPVIPTDRRIASDPMLALLVPALLPDAARLGDQVVDVEVTHSESSSPSHMADKTRNGRTISFTLDGAAASVEIQRWDGYAAVGIDNFDVLLDPKNHVGEDPGQRVATTAREACGGAYRSATLATCEQTEGGYYWVSRPDQGDAMSKTYKELYVSYFTDDGYVIRVDSYNTGSEKSGPVVATEPVLSVQESLALATSPEWFIDK